MNSVLRVALVAVAAAGSFAGTVWTVNYVAHAVDQEQADEDSQRIATLQSGMEARALLREAEALQMAESPEAPQAPPEVMSFVDWVAENWSAPTKAAPDPECFGPEDLDAGWCEGSVVVDGAGHGVKWRKANSAAVEFESQRFPGALWLSCENFGAKVLRKWVWSHGGGHHSVMAHCELQGGALTGQGLWIKNTQTATYVRIFSKEYLLLDPDFAQALQTQGRTLE